jgi:hypothetical protein
VGTGGKARVARQGGLQPRQTTPLPLYVRLPPYFIGGIRTPCHPFVIGELACCNLRNRKAILSLLQELPSAIQADEEETLKFMKDYRLMGKGLGYIDIHLLLSALLTNIPLWTTDLRLNEFFCN